MTTRGNRIRRRRRDIVIVAVALTLLILSGLATVAFPANIVYGIINAATILWILYVNELWQPQNRTPGARPHAKAPGRRTLTTG